MSITRAIERARGVKNRSLDEVLVVAAIDEHDAMLARHNLSASVGCLRPLGCDCPACLERFGPIARGNVGTDLRSNPTGEVSHPRKG